MTEDTTVEEVKAALDEHEEKVEEQKAAVKKIQDGDGKEVKE